MHRSAPLDLASESALAAQGLRLALVDTADAAAFTAWLRADHRGFHLAEAGERVLASSVEGIAYRRTTGVWDPTARDAALPVATVNSWIADLTVPGARVDAWAISAVTVAPTHRRRGIARNLLEAELRTAAALGVPLAALTVSESTIYGRFGFGTASFAAELTIDTRRARWAGPAGEGRVHFVTLAEFREEAEALHDRIRRSGVGQVDSWSSRWDRIAELVTDDESRARSLRAVRYDDASGEARGLALYRMSGGEPDFAAHTLTVELLSTETPDAYAALWRFLLEVDLVSTVKAADRAVDEPLLWQVADMRAVAQSHYDHLWLRILDVPASLAARRYAADLDTVIAVDDALGIAQGTYALRVEDGAAVVERSTAPAELRMTVNELSAVYLGGVSLSVLVDAGRVEELVPGAAAAFDAAVRTARAPWLSFWF